MRKSEDRHGGDSGFVLEPNGLLHWTTPAGTITYNLFDEKDREAYIARLTANGAWSRAEVEAQLKRDLQWAEGDGST